MIMSYLFYHRKENECKKNHFLLASPDGSGILEVPIFRDVEIQRTAGTILTDKNQAIRSHSLAIQTVFSFYRKYSFAIYPVYFNQR